VTAFDQGWALRPEGLALVAHLVAAGRRSVVECGSGLSTITIARALDALGDGHVHALEHSAEWAATTRQALAEEELDGYAAVIDAPLVEGWYDRATLDRLPAEGIDLLLVDGPPAGEPGREQSRYTALPMLADRLASNAAIVLDDVERDGERWALGRWLAEFQIRLDPAPAGLALAVYLPLHGRDKPDNESERKA